MGDMDTTFRVHYDETGQPDAEDAAEFLGFLLGRDADDPTRVGWLEGRKAFGRIADQPRLRDGVWHQYPFGAMPASECLSFAWDPDAGAFGAFEFTIEAIDE